MKRVAVFGKPAGGKSTFSKRLSRATGISLHPLDLIEYYPDGSRVDAEVFRNKHKELLSQEEWIIDGFGTMPTFNARLAAADTLFYIDLPYRVHYWWVIKRFLKSPFKAPEGWPDGSDVLNGTIASFKTLRKCPAFWNDEFVAQLYSNHPDKKIYIIKSTSELDVTLYSES